MTENVKILSGFMFLKVDDEDLFGTFDRLCYKVMDSIFRYQTGCDDLIIGYIYTYFTEDSDPENVLMIVLAVLENLILII
jgi:hypothetical protein